MYTMTSATVLLSSLLHKYLNRVTENYLCKVADIYTKFISRTLHPKVHAKASFKSTGELTGLFAGSHAHAPLLHDTADKDWLSISCSSSL